MRKLFCVLSAAVVFLCSCQKEKSFEDPGGTTGGGTPSVPGLLTRVVSVAGADSSATDYTYDDNKSLITVTYTSTKGGNQYTRLYRNAAGIVTQFTVKNDDYVSNGVDSVVTILNYDQSKSRYSYSITNLNFSGVDYRDSTVYSYNSNGRLLNKTSYLRGASSPYLLYSKTDYSFNSGNNVAIEKLYSYDLTTKIWDLEATYNYTYDDKINPLPLGPIGQIALDDATYAGINNATSFEFTDSANPTNNFGITMTYTYNNENKPAGGSGVENSTSGSFDLRYYYN